MSQCILRVLISGYATPCQKNVNVMLLKLHKLFRKHLVTALCIISHFIMYYVLCDYELFYSYRNNITTDFHNISNITQESEVAHFLKAIVY